MNGLIEVNIIYKGDDILEVMQKLMDDFAPLKGKIIENHASPMLTDEGKPVDTYLRKWSVNAPDEYYVETYVTLKKIREGTIKGIVGNVHKMQIRCTAISHISEAEDMYATQFIFNIIKTALSYTKNFKLIESWGFLEGEDFKRYLKVELLEKFHYSDIYLSNDLEELFSKLNK